MKRHQEDEDKGGIKDDDTSFTLNQCRLTEKGMDRYHPELQNYINTVFTSPAGGPSLLDFTNDEYV